MPGTQIKVFDKIVQVIELLATSSQGVTLKKAQQALGLNKGTAFRILRALESHDVAARDENGTFVLGNRALWWGTRYRQNLDLLKVGLTERTVTERKRLERKLNQCLARGYAFSEGERLANTSSIAAPIFGPNKEVLGVISVNGPSDRLMHSRCNAIAPILLREARLVTQRLNEGNSRSLFAERSAKKRARGTE
ncbi:MAG: helix-turn-helix domain-containing protein [Deltaproteobacteria bacterium]|nr:helix-turn-helix domain-containing protein [Deltaproteobacteria bacterium]